VGLRAGGWAEDLADLLRALLALLRLVLVLGVSALRGDVAVSTGLAMGKLRLAHRLLLLLRLLRLRLRSPALAHRREAERRSSGRGGLRERISLLAELLLPLLLRLIVVSRTTSCWALVHERSVHLCVRRHDV
jgi:hypothetical protein